MTSDIENKEGSTIQPEECDVALPAEEQPSEPEALQQKYDELNDRHLRLLAEYDNFRKRSAREKDESYRNATASVLQKILPIQDNFERAAGYDCASEEFAKGFTMIEKALSETLASFGVEPLGEVGEAFDPQKHHAVAHIDDDELGENVVAAVLQKGYKMGEKILRHAMVQTAN